MKSGGVYFSQMLAHIEEKHLPCFFFVPGLDDVTLSCGGLLSNLAQKTEVVLFTLFAKNESRLHLAQVERGYHFLGKTIQSFVFSYPEAYLRRPEQEEWYFSELVRYFQHVFPYEENAYYFCPLSNKKQSDFYFTRLLCTTLYPRRIVYYLPYPEKRGDWDTKYIRQHHLFPVLFNQQQEKRRFAILSSPSQHARYFSCGKLPDSIPPEYYFLPSSFSWKKSGLFSC